MPESRTIPHKKLSQFRWRALLVALVLALVAGGNGLSIATSAASESLVPFLHQPEADSKLARDNSMIIVVLFEYEDCPWCEYILEHEIEPIIRSGAFKSTVIFRRADISDSATELTSFDGTPTTSHQLAKNHGVSISPTLVFLNAEGDVMAPQLVGVSSRDFYGYYLEKRIAEALVKLGETS